MWQWHQASLSHPPSCRGHGGRAAGWVALSLQLAAGMCPVLPHLGMYATVGSQLQHPAGHQTSCLLLCPVPCLELVAPYSGPKSPRTTSAGQQPQPCKAPFLTMQGGSILPPPPRLTCRELCTHIAYMHMAPPACSTDRASQYRVRIKWGREMNCWVQTLFGGRRDSRVQRRWWGAGIDSSCNYGPFSG